MNTELLIQEFMRNETSEEEIAVIAVRMKCDYDVRVRSPKLTMIFRNGDQDRRFPMRVDNYYPEEGFDRCVLFASASVELARLFTRPFSQDPVELSFELTYGDYIESAMPFAVLGDVKPNLPGFTVKFDEARHRVLFYSKAPVKAEHASAPVRVVKGVLRLLHAIILALLSVVLLPWFLVEAGLSLIGCAAVSPNVKSFQAPRLRYLMQVKYSYQGLWHRKMDFFDIKDGMNTLYRLVCFFCPVKKNRITFLSSRRADMTGNPDFVYQQLKDDPSLDFRFLMDADPFFHLRLKNILRFLYLYATSRVVLVDDFFQLLNYVDKRDSVKLIQLWHACGAFKTFGFSRLGKPGGPKQRDLNHRQYDYAIVSSQEIAKYYAEGFGIPESHVVATGVPRTDIFMDQGYRAKVRAELFAKYPILQQKKVLLFAPTFRGNGQKTAYYPIKRFDPVKLYEATGGEYVIILKLHPFCQARYEIPEDYREVILDFSNESELNDLLFVTDLLVTDYSSVVFEASLLNIPMLLYAYDLRGYIAQRDFYYEYEGFVPGKIVQTEEALAEAIRTNDFETEKIEPFCKRFFDNRDGKSTERVVQLIRSL